MKNIDRAAIIERIMAEARRRAEQDAPSAQTDEERKRIRRQRCNEYQKQYLKRQRQQLDADPVAQRQYRDKRNAAERALRKKKAEQK